MVKFTPTEEDEALLAALGVEAEAKKAPERTLQEERIIAGFEEIQHFVKKEERLPSAKEGNDIFERIYAIRLEQICGQKEYRDILSEFDHQGLLEGKVENEEKSLETLDDDELLAELGVTASDEDDITNLRHVKPQSDKKAAEEIANRKACKDFDRFKPLFEKIKHELDAEIRQTKKLGKDVDLRKADIKKGNFFILGGQMAYIDAVGEIFTTPDGRHTDARLRVIYSNATESDLLLRSMQRALSTDETSRVISEPVAGPLFSGTVEEEDTSSGTIYALRSKSDNPIIKEKYEFLHKIGVTSGSVEKRIANATHDATFLLADVEIVATYKLFNINRIKLENIIHKFFAPARLEIQIKDRFGEPVVPREWFLVPLFAIGEAVEKIKDGTIGDYKYDAEHACITKIDKGDSS